MMTKQMEQAIKRVTRAEAALTKAAAAMKALGLSENGVANPCSFPAGSPERIAALDLERAQLDLKSAQRKLAEREELEARQADRMTPKKAAESKPEQPSVWMQSSAGTWHKYAGTYFGGAVGSCQSYNLDRTNALHGEPVAAPPEGARICKKCLGKNSGIKWK